MQKDEHTQTINEKLNSSWEEYCSLAGGPPGISDLCSHVEPGDREVMLQKGSLFAIADGLGDEEIQAADLTLQRMAQDYYAEAHGSPADILRVAISRIGKELFSRNTQGREPSQAVDLTVAVVVNNRVTIANVGRNRVYFIHDGQWQLITHDPSGVTEMLRQGIANLEEAENAAASSLHIQRLGEVPEPEIELIEDIPVISGDILLLANENIAHRMEDNNFSVFNHSDDPTSICNELVALNAPESIRENRILLVLRFSQSGSLRVEQQSLSFPLPEMPPQIADPVESIHQNQNGHTGKYFPAKFPWKIIIAVCGLLVLLGLGWMSWRQPPESHQMPLNPTAIQLVPGVTKSSFVFTLTKPVAMPSETATLSTATRTSQRTPLSTVTPSPGVTFSTSITPTFQVADTRFVCVWEVQQGNSLFSSIRRFNLPYQADETYYYYSDCSKETGTCGGEIKEIESPSRIEIGWFIIVPVTNSDACQSGQGAWLKGSVESP